MIQFSLKCAKGHQFDSWFQSGAAFDKLHAAGMVSCVHCGDTSVEKALMAPRVNATEDAPDVSSTPLSAPPQDKAAKALAELRAHVEKNSDYVGGNFAQEARAMHDGDAPERPIWGEARSDEAKKLIDDGVPVAPLPFVPTRKTN